MKRTVRAIAMDIFKVWSKLGKGVNYAARPYLEAMLTLDNASDNYGMDSGKSIINYFLANAATFRGPEAKALKEELKSHLK